VPLQRGQAALTGKGHVIDRRPSGPMPMGEPEAGRSALDRRSAGGRRRLKTKISLGGRPAMSEREDHPRSQRVEEVAAALLAGMAIEDVAQKLASRPARSIGTSNIRCLDQGSRRAQGAAQAAMPRISAGSDPRASRAMPSRY